MASIPIISDTDKKWYNEYGVETSLKKTLRSILNSSIKTVSLAIKKKIPFYPAPGNEHFSRIPAEFLVNAEGLIKQAHYPNRLTHRLPIKAIVSFATQA